MEEDLEAGTDRETESGLEKFVEGNSLKGVYPKGTSTRGVQSRALDTRFHGYDIFFALVLNCHHTPNVIPAGL